MPHKTTFLNVLPLIILESAIFPVMKSIIDDMTINQNIKLPTIWPDLDPVSGVKKSPTYTAKIKHSIEAQIEDVVAARAVIKF